MDLLTGRPDSIEDWLVEQHSGQWFGFNGEHTYANLVIHDSSITKPTEEECNQGLVDMQAEFDAKAYARNRKGEYPDIGDQLDDLFKAGAFSTEMTATIQAVKDKYPKE